MRRSKYKNIPVVIDGIKFPSKLEGRRYSQLLLLQRAHVINNLECQPAIPITINGIKICVVKGDFSYFENGKRVFEDTKGFHTPISKLKMKMVKAMHPGIDWRIIT
jgi:hypothetical protein